MRSHWSLVAFTLLIQSAAGSIWCLQAAAFLSDAPLSQLFLKFQVVAAVGVLFLGLVMALAHLGNPSACFYAVRNIKSSWLSREIAAVSLFGVVLMALTLIVFIRPALLNDWTLLICSAASGLALYAMIKVYRLKTVGSWNHTGTAINYIGSAMLLGGILFMLVTSVFISLKGTSDIHLVPVIFRNISMAVVFIGMMVKTAAIGLGPSTLIASPGRFKMLWPIIQGCGGVLWIISLLFIPDSGIKSVLFLTTGALLIAGEILHRIEFYESYNRAGL